MRYIFKTDYNQDIKLAKHGGHVFWYGLLSLALLVAPWIMNGQSYLLSATTSEALHVIAEEVL